MKVEREVIIDLLPAYFSGEASAATRALVEEYFREHPDFEKTARSAGGPLEELKVPLSALEAAKEKFAFERARQVRETTSAFLWIAIIFSLLPFLFRFQDHRIVWVLWHGSNIVGLTFSLMAALFWLLFISNRRRREPMRQYTTFLWNAVFFTLLLGIFQIKDHKVVFLYFADDPTIGVIFTTIAVAMWIGYFILRRKAKQKG